MSTTTHPNMAIDTLIISDPEPINALIVSDLRTTKSSVSQTTQAPIVGDLTTQAPTVGDLTTQAPTFIVSDLTTTEPSVLQTTTAPSVKLLICCC